MIVKLRSLPILIVVIVVMAVIAGIGIWQLLDPSPVKDSSESSVKSSTVTVAKQSLVESEKSFFPYFRLQREKVRSQQLELLKEIINNPNTDDKSKQAALTRLLTITNAMEMELKIEGLLKAQGFKEGIVILQDTTASVIISGPQMNETKETEIKNQVAQVLKMKSQEVSLINRE